MVTDHVLGAGIAQWLERQTREQKVPGLITGCWVVCGFEEQCPCLVLGASSIW